MEQQDRTERSPASPKTKFFSLACVMAAMAIYYAATYRATPAPEEDRAWVDMLERECPPIRSDIDEAHADDVISALEVREIRTMLRWQSAHSSPERPCHPSKPLPPGERRNR